MHSPWLWRSHAMDPGSWMGMKGRILVVMVMSVQVRADLKEGNGEDGKHKGCTFDVGTAGSDAYSDGATGNG